jgi:phage terminase large subunit
VFIPLKQPEKRKIRKELEARFPKIFKPLDDNYRYKVMYGGRAAARSWSVSRKLLIRGTEKPLLILCTRELQKSIKQSVHRLLSNQIRLLGLEHFYEIQADKIIGINGTEIIFLGIKHNTEEIKSTEGIDIVWIEEAHNLTEGGWDIIEPTIRKEDSEIWITFNTRFKFDFVYQHFIAKEPPPGTLVIFSNYWDNPYFPEVLRQSMEHMKATNYEKYQHIWCGELRLLAEGAIFGKSVIQVEKDGRRCYVPIEKNCEVLTFFDLGKGDYTAIWFMQRVGLEYRMIDYFQGRLEEVEYYTKFIKYMNYLYARHYLPHDAEHERLGMKKNLREQFEEGGVKPTEVVPRITHKQTAIDQAREMFPRCWFHRGDDKGKPVEQCEGYYPHTEDEDMMTRTRRVEKGYEALCNYRYKYKDEDDVFQLTPHHDWASNGADAFQQFAQSHFETIHDDDYSDWSIPING